MSLTEELVDVMNRCPDPDTRKRLAAVVRKMREPIPPTRIVNPKRAVSRQEHDAAVAVGTAARARGSNKSEAAAFTGNLQLRNAWLAGWNDEDIRRGGK